MIRDYWKRLTDEQVEKIADYWTSKVNGLTPDNGARAGLGEHADTASLWTGMLFRKPTMEQLSAFYLGLKDILSHMSLWDGYYFEGTYLGVDYDACFMLREVARSSGVCENNFPYKTRMYIDRDTGKITVQEGCEAEPKEI